MNPYFEIVHDTVKNNHVLVVNKGKRAFRMNVPFPETIEILTSATSSQCSVNGTCLHVKHDIGEVVMFVAFGLLYVSLNKYDKDTGDKKLVHKQAYCEM